MTANAPSGSVVEQPPLCCGEAMVHNSFTGMYECADAYFWLDSEGLLGDCGDLVEWRRPLTEFDRERYAHWWESWIDDGEKWP